MGLWVSSIAYGSRFVSYSLSCLIIGVVLAFIPNPLSVSVITLSFRVSLLFA